MISKLEAFVRADRKAGKAKAFNLPHHPRESELHVSVAQYLDWALIPPSLYTTFPAGWGKLNKATAGRLYASGMKKGFPDILVFGHRRGIPVTIGIELKAGANSVSAAQREMFAKLQAVGIRVYIARSIEDVVDALREENIPCRRLAINGNGPQPNQTAQTGPAPPDTFRPPT